ncbi:hypothetical protein [Natrinema halophilum]|uniref:Uncharacterized protein n=1 Tax=Natrinema halophilum TaxID=1699371 RepID=A0A7D5KXD9_9EURY|nr:hypothetical protein [Natrinema halophilum]QLG48922.1 hypothetical protein HYG82_08690 [Natrinema halophilum]
MDIVLEKRSLVFATSFLFIGVVSSAVLLVFPSEQMTHPYNAGAWIVFETEPLLYSRDNFTQTVLRIFSFGSMFVIATAFTKELIAKSIRLLVLEGVFVGAFGVAYQLSILFGFPLIEASQWFGLVSIKYIRPFLGPLPQMMSVPGEPGYTAIYFLFLLSLIIPVAISGQERILSNRESVFFGSLFVCFLILTGAGTGFGGLVILSIVLFTYYTFVKDTLPSFGRFVRFGFQTSIPALVVALVVMEDPIGTASVVIQELTFRGGSGPIRAHSMAFALDLFQTRPLIGYGFGSYYGASVVGTILVSTGVIGVTLFVAFHLFIVRDLIQLEQTIDIPPLESSLARTLAISLTALFATMLVAKSITAIFFPWYWMAVGFGIALLTETYKR